MKKITSTFIALTLVFIIFLFSISAFAENDELSVDEYYCQLAELTQTYNVGGIFSGSFEVTQEKLSRLIVKTNNNNHLKEDCGAIAKIEGYNGIHILQYSDLEIAELAYDYYKNLIDVEFVEFDFAFRELEPETVYVEHETNKEYLSWGSYSINTNTALSYVDYYGENAPEIVVAVIDTGIDLDHEFFGGRIIDSKKNFLKKDGSTDDDHGHGTHVAGIIIDNTAENVKVSGYKSINNQGGGFYSTTCSAIDSAVDDNVDVINMSLGWFNENDVDCYNLFETCIQKAVDNGIPVVVAAGNFATDATNISPASNNNVITVSAVDIDDNPWHKSNFGSCVDIAAPGVGINSCVPGDAYEQWNGTSMATPFVSAAAAFLKTVDPNFSPDTIEQIIKYSSYVPEDWDTDYGVGILDFSLIISNIASSFPKITINEEKKAVITSEATNATFYYTTDGSEPTISSSNVYSEPIDIASAICIKAISLEKGKLPSACATLKINWKEDLTIRYKGTKNMLLPPNSKITSCYSHNEDIVAVDKNNQTIYGVAPGETKVTVFLETGQKVTYNVTVEYESWQWFIIYFLGGWIWYVPEPFFPFIKQ